MPRKIKVAAAQVGRVDTDADRKDTLARLIALLEQAGQQGVNLVVFPEIALTTFFPRMVGLDDDMVNNPEKLDMWYEKGPIVENPNVKPLFDKATELGIDVHIGYAELTEDGKHYNTCSYVKAGKELAKYRKVRCTKTHLPGFSEPFANPESENHLEKRYFLPGDTGFQAFRVPGPATDEEHGEPIMGMMICNDRRWPESWRNYGLQGAEIVMVGYNTPFFQPEALGHGPDEDPEVRKKIVEGHHLLCMQAHTHTNATFSISSARCGYDNGVSGMIGSSTIIHPEGHIIAISKTWDDELVVAEIDLDECKRLQEKTFNFGKHRRIEHYQRLATQTGVVKPPRVA
ncbi:hypothetical protein MNV49_000620 [Pseudohyphozyma bogoriensis]|nr:hypothetical protein MNV49_000620 [Pseudohyphozyma bogoriensis]